MNRCRNEITVGIEIGQRRREVMKNVMREAKEEKLELEKHFTTQTHWHLFYPKKTLITTRF